MDPFQRTASSREKTVPFMARIATALLVPLLLLASCGGQEPESVESVRAAPVEKVLKIAVPNDPGPLDPSGMHFSVPAASMVYDTLVTIAQDGSVVPNLAESWSRSGDGMVWTFSLRPNLRFHDGSPCTADAVVFSLTRSNLHFANRFMDVKIDRVECVDEHTLTVTLKEPFAPFLRYLTLPYLSSILSPNCVNPAGSPAGEWQHPIGTGPFKLKTWTKRHEMVLEKNPDYWLKSPRLDGIVLKVIPDPESRLLALEAGEIDLLYFNWDFHGAVNVLPAQKMKRLERFKQVSDAGSVTKILQMNTIKYPLNRRELRTRIAHVMERSELADLVGAQTAPADAGLFPPWMNQLFGLTPLSYRHDPDETVPLKATENYGPVTFIVNALMPGDRLVAEYLQDKLASTGIEIRIRRIEDSLYWKAIREKDYDLAFNVTLGIHYDPYGTFRFGLDNNGHAKPAYLDDPAIRSRVAALFKTMDPGEQKQLIASIYSAVYEEVACIPLLYEKQFAIMSPSVQGFSFGAHGVNIPWWKIDLAAKGRSQ